MALVEVDDSSDAELSDTKVEDSPYDSSERACPLNGFIEVHDCISASAN